MYDFSLVEIFYDPGEEVILSLYPTEKDSYEVSVAQEELPEYAAMLDDDPAMGMWTIVL